MSYSLLLLTASWAVGQSSYVPAGVYSPAGTAIPHQVYTPAVSEPEPAAGWRLGIFSRVRNIFHRPNNATVQPATMMVAPQGSQMVAPQGAEMTTPQDGRMALPQGPAEFVPQGATTAEPPLAGDVQQTSMKTEAPELNKKYREQAGSGENYSWITGQLSHVRIAEGDVWVVRYAPVDQADQYGGSVVLATAVDMKNYREGDLVCVEGEILKDRQAPGHLGGALYRATLISMISRAD